ncbi:hypothetical protein [Cellulomonas soli]
MVAVIALVPVGAYLSQSFDTYQSTYTVYESPSDGIYVEGNQATNLFVYDSDGMPVPDAQVYDQDGRPVSIGAEVYESDANHRLWGMAAPQDLDGAPRWNVYPRARVADGTYDYDTGTFVGDPTDAPLPFAQAPAVRVRATPGSTTEPAASPSPSPTPSAAVDPAAPAAPADPAAPPAPGTPGAPETAGTTTAVTPAAP